MAFSIAIDGPAGAGKSTIARAVARALNFRYLDTGAMYRTCGLTADRNGVAATDEKALLAVVEAADIDVRFDDEGQHMWLDGEEVTHLLRTPVMSRWASDISKIPGVRNLMVDKQRALSETSNIVLDGRDIGTFVLPHASLKIYLTASPDERAQRRYDELAAKDPDHPSLEEVRKDLIFRDAQDSERTYAPLKQADDAIRVDTSGLTIAEVTALVLDLVRERYHG